MSAAWAERAGHCDVPTPLGDLVIVMRTGIHSISSAGFIWHLLVKFTVPELNIVCINRATVKCVGGKAVGRMERLLKGLRTVRGSETKDTGRCYGNRKLSVKGERKISYSSCLKMTGVRFWWKDCVTRVWWLCR